MKKIMPWIVVLGILAVVAVWAIYVYNELEDRQFAADEPAWVE